MENYKDLSFCKFEDLAEDLRKFIEEDYRAHEKIEKLNPDNASFQYGYNSGLKYVEFFLENWEKVKNDEQCRCGGKYQITDLNNIYEDHEYKCKKCGRTFQKGAP